MKEPLDVVLLVDDDDATNFLNKRLLKRLKITNQIHIAENGREALDFLTNKGEFADKGDDFPKPDLIFLDINMPLMNGWEFLEVYEQLPSTQRARAIVMMLTTSIKETDQKKAENSIHIKGFIHKPLNRQMIEEVIKHHFPNRF